MVNTGILMFVPCGTPIAAIAYRVVLIHWKSKRKSDHYGPIWLTNNKTKQKIAEMRNGYRP
jgi:hypothetical protein